MRMDGEREDLKFHMREFRSQGSVKRAGRESERDSKSRNFTLYSFLDVHLRVSIYSPRYSEYIKVCEKCYVLTTLPCWRWRPVAWWEADRYLVLTKLELDHVPDFSLVNLQSFKWEVSKISFVRYGCSEYPLRTTTTWIIVCTSLATSDRSRINIFVVFFNLQKVKLSHNRPKWPKGFRVG